MKNFILFIALFIVSSCAVTNAPNSEIPASEHIAVCGEKNGVEQTYPTL